MLKLPRTARMVGNDLLVENYIVRPFGPGYLILLSEPSRALVGVADNLTDVVDYLLKRWNQRMEEVETRRKKDE